MDKDALRHVLSESFGFLRQSFRQLLHTHQYFSSGAARVGKIVFDISNGISLIPNQGSKIVVIATSGRRI
jgi:hypothetical protein